MFSDAIAELRLKIKKILGNQFYINILLISKYTMDQNQIVTFGKETS